MARPVVALLSDFGTRDHYAGTMRGVILGICPDATLVDVTHDIQPHDIQAASLELAAAYRFFPAGSIFLVVVDPGVGSARRGLAADAGGHRFVAPDNGVLTHVFEQTPPRQVVELTERRYARPTISRTFEGRDRFAPAAAWLARGIRLSALGRPLRDHVTLDLPALEFGDGSIAGCVVRMDRFGNAVTNVDRKRFERLAAGGAIDIEVGGCAVGRLVETYADIGPGEVCALFGSTDHLEFAANAASAGERLDLKVGAAVRITTQ
jgi:S-adenosylmethionine hydrolase